MFTTGHSSVSLTLWITTIKTPKDRLNLAANDVPRCPNKSFVWIKEKFLLKKENEYLSRVDIYPSDGQYILYEKKGGGSDSVNNRILVCRLTKAYTRSFFEVFIHYRLT